MKTGAELTELMPALLDALATSGNALVVLADRGAGFERWYANRNAASQLGYTPEEIGELTPFEYIAPEFRPHLKQLSQTVRAGQPMPPALELQLLHKDGTRVNVEAALGQHAIADGMVYVILVRPTGTQHQLHMSLLEADRIGLVAALAAGFAHEINNPLTSVLLNLRSLRKQLSAMPEAAQRNALRCLDDITTGAERIASNVRALQTLATRSSTQTVDLAAVVSAALRLAAPTLEPRAHVVRQIMPVRAVNGEESRIGQAVLAMLLFSGSGFDVDGAGMPDNRIQVSVVERAPNVVVEVSDNGRELTTEEISGAFDPFFRSSARGAGVGVGLGVARSVAATLGGEVTLAPRPGGGAVIMMSLPAAPQP